MARAALKMHFLHFYDTYKELLIHMTIPFTDMRPLLRPALLYLDTGNCRMLVYSTQGILNYSISILFHASTLGFLVLL